MCFGILVTRRAYEHQNINPINIFLESRLIVSTDPSHEMTSRTEAMAFSLHLYIYLRSIVEQIHTFILISLDTYFLATLITAILLHNARQGILLVTFYTSFFNQSPVMN